MHKNAGRFWHAKNCLSSFYHIQRWLRQNYGQSESSGRGSSGDERASASEAKQGTKLRLISKLRPRFCEKTTNKQYVESSVDK
jgi:hypothetical protein